MLEPVEVNALFRELRRVQDRAMVEAMVLGGLRRCEALGLRLEDLRPAERRVKVAEGKGGHQRMVSISPRFFRSVSIYMQTGRPENASTDRLFVVLKGPRRGRPLSDGGLEGHRRLRPQRSSSPDYRRPPRGAVGARATQSSGPNDRGSSPCGLLTRSTAAMKAQVAHQARRTPRQGRPSTIQTHPSPPSDHGLRRMARQATVEAWLSGTL
ncbi:MAG: tyrosine-type recombinase/integrase [Acidimicrobiales bacterium]